METTHYEKCHTGSNTRKETENEKNGNEEKERNYMKKRHLCKHKELTSSLCPKQDAKDNNLAGIQYLNNEQTRDHLMTHTHLKGLSICNQCNIKQQTLGSECVQSTQQCGSVRWRLKVNRVQGSVLQAPLPYPRHLPPRCDLRLSQHL